MPELPTCRSAACISSVILASISLHNVVVEFKGPSMASNWNLAALQPDSRLTTSLHPGDSHMIQIQLISNSTHQTGLCNSCFSALNSHTTWVRKKENNLNTLKYKNLNYCFHFSHAIYAHQSLLHPYHLPLASVTRNVTITRNFHLVTKVCLQC